MAKQPTFRDVGNVAVSAERPVGTYDVKPLARSSQEIAKAGARFGQAIEGVGEAVNDTARRRDQTQYVNAMARGLTRGIDLRSQLRTNPDHGAIEPLWNDGAGKIIEDEAAGIESPTLREKYRAVMARHFAGEHASITDQAFRGKADAAGAAIAADRQNLVATTSPDGDALHNAKIEVHNALIDTAEQNGYLGHEAALQEKRRSANDIAVAKYRQMGRLDPERTIAELDQPDSPNAIVQLLPAETREGLIAHARDNQRARQLDAERAAYLGAQQARRASDDAEGAIMHDLLADNPAVTVSGIVDHDALTPAAKQRLTAIAARVTQPDPAAQDSNAAAAKLIDRIRRPDGDAEKISDMTPIIDAYNAGELSRKDLAAVAGQLNPSPTPDNPAPEDEAVVRRNRQ
jgi:hypothetical protein